MDAVIKADKLTVEFPLPPSRLSRVALWDFSLTINRGEFVSIVGPSGCAEKPPS